MTLPNGEALPKVRVLVVEDDEEIRASLIAALEEFDNCTIDVAPNGRVGLEKLRLSRPDILLLDLMMPEVDGYQVLRELRSLGPGERPGRTIVLSAHVDGSNTRQLTMLGADACVQKPFTVAELFAALNLPKSR
jgi:two-component system response regulator MprA